MKTTTMSVSKKENGKHVKVGEVAIVVPILEDIASIIASKVTGEDEGIPLYDSEIANWVQDAMLAYIKADARNKLVSGTVDLKPDAKIATNWDEIVATGTRNSGAALALYREAKEAFSAYVATLGKSAKAAETIVTLFGNRSALALQSAANKSKMATYVTGFAEALTEQELERFTRPINAVMAATEEESTDF